MTVLMTLTLCATPTLAAYTRLWDERALEDFASDQLGHRLCYIHSKGLYSRFHVWRLWGERHDSWGTYPRVLNCSVVANVGRSQEASSFLLPQTLRRSIGRHLVAFYITYVLLIWRSHVWTNRLGIRTLAGEQVFVCNMTVVIQSWSPSISWKSNCCSSAIRKAAFSKVPVDRHVHSLLGRMLRNCAQVYQRVACIPIVPPWPSYPFFTAEKPQK